MDQTSKLVPSNPNEVVIPVGRANLVTTKEDIDQALEIAGRIFRNKKEVNMSIQELGNELNTSVEVEEETFTILTADQLAALPATKYGRDDYGRTLNKDGSVRSGRSDKGSKRGEYAARAIKVEEPVPSTPY